MGRHAAADAQYDSGLGLGGPDYSRRSMQLRTRIPEHHTDGRSPPKPKHLL